MVLFFVQRERSAGLSTLVLYCTSESVHVGGWVPVSGSVCPCDIMCQKHTGRAAGGYAHTDRKKKRRLKRSFHVRRRYDPRILYVSAELHPVYTV